MASAAEQVYQYLAPSAVRSVGGRTEVMLATSGGNVEAQPSEHPRFFDGFLARPEQTTVGLLTCARVARTRYYTPPAMVAAILAAADPGVTSEWNQLRFESFSVCCGVYARLDVLSDSLDRAPTAIGTTNVDFNPPMRAALARLSGSQAVRFHVGADELGIKTFGGQIVEHKVPLPERWIKGLAEVQMAATRLTPLVDLTTADARAFVRSLPRTSRQLAWAQPAGRSLRLSSQPPPRPRPPGGGPSRGGAPCASAPSPRPAPPAWPVQNACARWSRSCVLLPPCACTASMQATRKHPPRAPGSSHLMGRASHWY